MPNDDDSSSSDPDPDPDSSSNSGSEGEFAGEGSENNENAGGTGGATNETASSSGHGDDGSEPSAPFVYPAAPGEAVSNNDENFDDEDPLVPKPDDEDGAEGAAAASATPSPLTDDPMIKPLIIFIVVCTLLAVIIFPILFKVVLPNSKDTKENNDDNINSNDGTPAPLATSNPIFTPAPTLSLLTPSPAPLNVSTPPPTPLNITSPPLELVVDLPESLKTKILADPTSSAALAHNWLLQDPNLSTYSMEQRKQRFALAGLFYSTGGAGWSRASNWMVYSADQSECIWEGVICGASSSVTPPPMASSTVGPATYEPINTTMAPSTSTDANSTFAPGTTDNVTNIFNQGRRNLRRNLQVNTTMAPTVTTVATAALQPFQSVQFLDLSSNNLGGSLPEEFSLLTDLKILNLHSNSLSGSIPAILLETLVNLQEFYVNNNQLMTGNLPTAIGSLSILALLDLSSNQFSGALPTELGLLVLLQKLMLRDNRFNSILPNELSALGALNTLDCGQNAFTGPIPPTWTSMKSLSSLLLDNNNLSGTIPPSIGPGYIDLKEFNIVNNPLLTGVIPNVFCYIDKWNFTCTPDQSFRLLCGCGCSCGDGVSPLMPPGDLSTPGPATAALGSVTNGTNLPVGVGTANPAAQGTTNPAGIGTADPSVQATTTPAGPAKL